MENKNTLLYGGGFVLLVLLVVLFFNKSKKEKELQENVDSLSENINQGNVAGTITGATSGAKPDNNYNPANDAEQIWSSGCYKSAFWGSVCAGGGNEQKVASVLRKLSKGQLLRLKEFFPQRYNQELDDFFKGYFFESEQTVIYQALASIR